MILVVATCFFRKSHSIKCTTHPKTHIQPTTHKCHNPQPTKSKFPFSIMDEDCSQMLRDIRVQGPPRISRCKKVRDIRGLRANIPRISRKSARYPRGARYPRARSPADISYEISAGCEISACYRTPARNDQNFANPYIFLSSFLSC